jgi:hypothetical protein
MGANAKDPKDHDVRQSSTDDPRVAYVPSEYATPEGELAALAAVYAFILKCHKQKHMAAEDSDSEHETIGKEVSEDGRA